MTTTLANQTITFTVDGFIPAHVVIADGIITEYRRDTMVGQWAIQRAPQYDQDTFLRALAELATDEGQTEYGVALANEYRDLVAFIGDDAYLLTQTEVGAAITIDPTEVE